MVGATGRLSWLAFGAFSGALVLSAVAVAQGPPNGQGVYQRHAGDGGWRGHERRRDRYDRPTPMMTSPQVSSGWFQRPYPYHLDYYKMRYGGSYAPYFGNLYGTPFGTPQVVNGGWGPEAGGPASNGGGPPPQGYEWMDSGPYANGVPQGAVMEAPVDATSTNGVTTEQKTQAGAAQANTSESLPPPKK